MTIGKTVLGLVATILAVLSLNIAFADEAAAYGRKWVYLGEVSAKHTTDHDTIYIRGKNDVFRKLKFTVRDAPVNFDRIVVTFDNGTVQNLAVRQVVEKGGETRVIDLKGNKRGLRRVDFWYDTRGRFQGTADVRLYARR